MSRRIIDSEIDLWQSFVEHHEAKLRRCVPSAEPAEQARLEAAKTVLQAMHAFKLLTDGQEPVMLQG